MSKTITELTTQIEELEKRIRSISASQSSLSQIIAIRDCIDQIKEYLQELNDTLENFQGSASDAELDVLKARVSICENDISALQTELATTQDEISTLQADLNATNTTVGEHTTTITNLQTTQTNLQTTQSSQASTINNINSRLTTAENNISTLTGGVDVGEIDGRLNTLEINSGPSAMYRLESNQNVNITSTLWRTKNYHFSCAKGEPVYVCMEFHITVNTADTSNSTFSMAVENIVFTEKKIRLNTNTTYVKVAGMYIGKYMTNRLQTTISTNADVVFNSVEITIIGQNVRLNEYQKEICVHCFDGYIYITRQYGEYIRYGKFLPTDTINLGSLPNKRNRNNDNGSFTWECFLPYVNFANDENGVSYVSMYSDVMFGTTSVGKKSVINMLENDLVISDTISNVLSENNVDPAVGYFTNILEFGISKDKPGVLPIEQGYAYYLMYDNYKKGCYTFVSPVRNNHRGMGSAKVMPYDVKYVCRLDDGYMYFYDNLMSYPKTAKLDIGDFATIYEQADGSYNAYVANGTTTTKFKITFDETEKKYIVETITTLENCNCVYETYENKIIYYHTAQRSWKLETLEY